MDLEKTRAFNDSTHLHIAIVGTGSAAFAAAIKAVEQGAKVTLIESADIIGGTCVNLGCIPSKIFIRGAQLAHTQGHHGFAGLALKTPTIDRKAMLQQQQGWVEKLRYAKYESILESHPGIRLIRGKARFKNNNTLIVTQKESTEDKSQLEISADRILLAVGASPAVPNITGLSDTPYWTSNDALIAEDIPAHLIVLGASVVALELAQAFRHIGAEVSVIARSTLLSKEDPDIGEGLQHAFESEGIKIMLNTSVKSVSHDGKRFTLMTDKGKISADQLMLATGRKPNTAELDLDKTAVKTDKNGAIITDDHLRSHAKHIYAAGDCSNQPQFVYVAAAAGTRAAINMTGGDKEMDLSIVPAVIFTDPQVATVGLSEQQAIQNGLDVESRKLDLENVPRAIANMDTRGFIKLVAEKSNGRIVGCQILANEAGEIIQSAALAIRNRMSIEELAEQLFPYLTMVEGLKLTAQTFNKDIKQLSCCAG
ncbi:mercury(II) reductase [Beggiatoa alba]|nr:mercury(II) reductase [Beggiatoa alba]